jgi:DDE superfamily endonuclease
MAVGAKQRNPVLTFQRGRAAGDTRPNGCRACCAAFVCYALEFEKCLQAHERPVGDSWSADETYLKVRGQFYLYRAVDKSKAKRLSPT